MDSAIHRPILMPEDSSINLERRSEQFVKLEEWGSIILGKSANLFSSHFEGMNLRLGSGAL